MKMSSSDFDEGEGEKKLSWYPEEGEEHKYGNDHEHSDEEVRSLLEEDIQKDDGVAEENNDGEEEEEDFFKKEEELEFFDDEEMDEEEIRVETPEEIDYDELYGDVLGMNTKRVSSTDVGISTRTLDISNVERLINKLSKVKLVWPENLPFFNKAEFKKHPSRAKFPETFYTCSQKEKAVLWHAENFRKQYLFHFPNRRPLVIAPKNECGCQKLYPTYINPTVLGYPEFFHHESLMKFLKDFLAPDMFVDHPSKYPSHIRSHLTVLKKRRANAFEFSIVAASFLIGCGYDAYVVDGCATKTICNMTKKEDYLEEPISEQRNDVAIPNPVDPDEIDDSKFPPLEPVSPSKYKSKRKNILSSRYEQEMRQRMEAKLAEEIKETEETGKKAAEAAAENLEPPDPFYGKRTHAWILLLPGERNIEEPTFIEPFSGQILPVSSPEFLDIIAVFNNKNFYVNVQSTEGGLGNMSYDLEDPSKWNKLLIEPPKKKKVVKKDDDSTTFQDEDDTQDQPPTELYLDMPISFTPELEIPEEDYQRKFPDGKKTFEHNNALVELAAPYVNEDGMVKKVIKFDGNTRDPHHLEYIEECFKQRKDKMSRRVWHKEGSIVNEYFDIGRKDALKEHIHTSGKNKPSYPRHLYYYADYHPQNVAHREIIHKGMIEEFEGRDDFLYYRMTTYGGILCHTLPEKESKGSKARQVLELLKMDETGSGNRKKPRRQITKIIEKFHRNRSRTFDHDVAEIHMLNEEGRLRLIYHYADGSLTRNYLEFFKPKELSSDQVDFKPQDCIEFMSDRYAVPKDTLEKYEVLQICAKHERKANALARAAEDEVYDTVVARVQEDWRHELVQDTFALGGISKEKLHDDDSDIGSDEEQKEVKLVGIDFVSPYLEKYGMPKNKEDELLIKKRIVHDFKLRLIKKAKLMKSNYDQECLELRDKMNTYERLLPKMSATEREDFKHELKERRFQMSVIMERFKLFQERISRDYQRLLIDMAVHPILNKYSNIPPPQPHVVELTSAEKLKLAMEIAKAKDCCQFYHVKYVEPKSEEQHEQEQTL